MKLFKALRDDISDCSYVYGQLVYKTDEMTGKPYPAITTDGVFFTSCIAGTEIELANTQNS